MLLATDTIRYTGLNGNCANGDVIKFGAQRVSEIDSQALEEHSSF